MVSGCGVFFLSSFLSFFSFRYQSNACYKPYLLRAERQKQHETKTNFEITVTAAENDDIIHPTPRLKRRKSDDPVVAKCVICNKHIIAKFKNVPSLRRGESRVVYESYKI